MVSYTIKPDEPLWAVEAWRGWAALMVVAAHYALPAGLTGWGWGFAFTGVDLFFVLSGFVFAPYCWQPRTTSWGAYAVRRVFRIYPAYCVALAVMVWLAWLQGKPLLHLPEHLFMLHLQSREMAFYYNPAFWSLPAEVGFYVALPLLSIWCMGRPTRLLALAAVALVLRAFLMWQADPQHQNAAYVWLHNFPGIALEFAVGVWARRVSDRHSGAWRAWTRALTLITATLGWFALAWVFDRARHQGLGFATENLINLLSTLCFAGALVATTGRPAAEHTLASLRSWQRLGLSLGALSYGIYLTHMAWFHWAQWRVPDWGSGWAFGSALLGTAVSAWLLHRWVENPARQLGRAWANRIQNTSVSPG